MGPGAQPDRHPDRGADPRGRGRQLALRFAAGAMPMAALRCWPVLLLTAALPLQAVHAGDFAWQLPAASRYPPCPRTIRCRRPRSHSAGGCSLKHASRSPGVTAARAAMIRGAPIPTGAPSRWAQRAPRLRTAPCRCYNVAYNLAYGWQQPLVKTLEQQMRQPLLNRRPVEIGLDPATIRRSLPNSGPMQLSAAVRRRVCGRRHDQCRAYHQGHRRLRAHAARRPLPVRCVCV